MNVLRQLAIIAQAVDVRERWAALLDEADPDDPLRACAPMVVLPADTHPLTRLWLRLAGIA